mgnify:CR=1 FL=1
MGSEMCIRDRPCTPPPRNSFTICMFGKTEPSRWKGNPRSEGRSCYSKYSTKSICYHIGYFFFSEGAGGGAGLARRGAVGLGAARPIFDGIGGWDRRAGGGGPEPVAVGQWADRHRVLPAEGSAEPGAWRNGRTPYLVEVMDCLSVTHPAQRIVFMKSAQVGGTEVIVNALGYVGGALLVPRLLRRVKPAALLLGGALAASVFMGLSGFVVEAAPLLAQRLLAGFASALVFVSGGLLAARLAG